MAVATTYSTEVTNHKSATNDKNPTTATEGVLMCSSATVAVAAADDDTSKYVLLPVHSSWSLKHIWLYNDAITGGTDYNFGLYSSAATPVDVDENVYADAVDLSSARVEPIDILHEIRNITSINNKVWQDAGLSADSNVWYYLVATSVTVGTAAGDITVVVEYTY